MTINDVFFSTTTVAGTNSMSPWTNVTVPTTGVEPSLGGGYDFVYVSSVDLDDPTWTTVAAPVDVEQLKRELRAELLKELSGANTPDDTQKGRGIRLRESA